MSASLATFGFSARQAGGVRFSAREVWIPAILRTVATTHGSALQHVTVP